MGSILEGARNAVETCMGVKKGERILIVTDKSQLKIGNALWQASEKIAGEGKAKMIVLEDVASRPLTNLPKTIDDSIPNADITFWAAQSLPGELGARHRFINLAKKYARHGHMPNITATLMEQGMCSDYEEVYKLTQSPRFREECDNDYCIQRSWCGSCGRVRSFVAVDTK